MRNRPRSFFFFFGEGGSACAFSGAAGVFINPLAYSGRGLDLLKVERHGRARFGFYTVRLDEKYYVVSFFLAW